jgi:hypothetical protein
VNDTDEGGCGQLLPALIGDRGTPTAFDEPLVSGDEVQARRLLNV